MILQDEQEMERERERQRKLRSAEEERLKREAEQREKQRVDQERENIRKKEAEKRIEQLKSTDVGIRALEGLTEEVCQMIQSSNSCFAHYAWLTSGTRLCTLRFS